MWAPLGRAGGWVSNRERGTHMKPLTLTIDLKVADDTGVLSREVLRIGADDTRELIRGINQNVTNTVLLLVIEAQDRQLAVPLSTGE